MYDLVVIGAGPGGYYAADFAAKNGLKTAIFEAQNIGGVCLNYGCIPTKALLKASEYASYIKSAHEWGVNVSSFDIDINKMITHSRDVVKTLTGGIEYLFKKSKVDVLKTYAKISKINKDSFEIKGEDGKIVSAKRVILATGASQRALPNNPFSKRIWDVKTSMMPQFVPKKLAIIGAGAIGMEFANFYSNLGIQVTVLEMMPKILGNTDSEISQFVQKSFASSINFNLGIQIDDIKESDENVSISFSINGEKKIDKFDAVIVAIGVVPNIKDFPEVSLEKNYFKTNEVHETNIPNLFAIGDCASPPWLAHKATHEGIRVIRHIKGETLRALPNVPMCIYTHPQVASIGKTEDELRVEYGANFDEKVKVTRSHFNANGKALAIKEGQGLIKILVDRKTTELFGVHMVGPDVTELIHSCALGMQVEATALDWVETIFPHPTLSETMHEAFMEVLYK